MKSFMVFTLCCIAVGINAKKVRLTNNDLAQPGEFPYQVSLQIDGAHNCGGTLITKIHVLTAAHCVDRFTTGGDSLYRLTVVVGTTNLNGGTRMQVARVGHHPSFYRQNLQHDIAVIRLASEITESATVRTIALPSAYQELAAGTEVTISGFGANYKDGPASPVLKKLKMYVVDQRSCQAQWVGVDINPQRLCAVNSPNNGACQGDSGGPVTVNGQVVVGVASAVDDEGCGHGIPDIFVKVSHYLDYIYGEMAN